MNNAWSSTSLGELLSFSNGRSSPVRDDNAEYPVFGSNGIIGHAKEYNSPSNSIIIGRVGSYCGSVYLSPSSCWVTDNAIKSVAKGKNSAPFLYYLLGHLKLNQWREGSGQPLLNQSILKAINVEVPEPEEQESIAHILGTLDDKIERNHQMNETLEAMAQALFKSWFVDFDPVIDNALAAGNEIPEPLQARAEKRQALGEQRKPLPADIQSLFPDRFVITDEMGWVPKGWDITCFGNVSKCFDNKRIPLSKKQREDKKPGAIPYFGATSIMDYINEWIFDDVHLLVGEDGSVMHEDGTPFIQYIWGKTWVNNHAHVLQGAGGVSTEHLKLFMTQQNIAAYVTGAVQLKINQKNMNSIPFLKAGDALNNYFSNYLKPSYKKIIANSEEIKSLTKLRDTLLPKLLSGELRIPDAEKQVAEAV